MSKTDVAVRDVVAFLIGSQEFCIDAKSLREIHVLAPGAPLAQAYSDRDKLADLRGNSVRIIDLAAQFGLSKVELTKAHAVLIVNAGARTAGLLVNGVIGPLTVGAELFHPVAAEGPFIAGIIEVERRRLSMLALDILLAASDVQVVA